MRGVDQRSNFTPPQPLFKAWNSNWIFQRSLLSLLPSPFSTTRTRRRWKISSSISFSSIPCGSWPSPLMELSHPNSLLYTWNLISRSDSTENLGGCQLQFKAFPSKRQRKKDSTGICLSLNSSFFLLSPWKLCTFLLCTRKCGVVWSGNGGNSFAFVCMRMVVQDPVGILKICEHLFSLVVLKKIVRTPLLQGLLPWDWPYRWLP